MQQNRDLDAPMISFRQLTPELERRQRPAPQEPDARAAKNGAFDKNSPQWTVLMT